jgi:hypothetical protein
MKTMRYVFLALVLSFFAAHADAQAMKAGRINELCAHTETPSMETEMCIFYIRGWGDALILFSKETRVKFADDINPGQMARVFVKYVKEHPEKENDTARLVLMLALLDAKLLSVVPEGDSPRK